MRQSLEAPGILPPPVPALTSGLIDGNLVHITGQLAFDADIGGVPPGSDAAAQTEIILRRMETLLATQGLTTHDLVKVTIFITDPRDLMAVNDVYARYVSEPYPARSTIGVAFLALAGAKVEIEGFARLA